MRHLKLAPDASHGQMIGIVAIGRNEGQRLRRCLESVIARDVPIVYVDSGSSDGSAALARSIGVDVIELDDSRPYTAARGRNAGWRHLRESSCAVEFVQFLDGDCVLCAGWLEEAIAFFQTRSDVAVVCGRLREEGVSSSLYARLCDIEWNVPEGETASCGGIAMMRLGALAAVGGFKPDLIAGEEPELCLRLRDAGWNIVRLGIDMAYHDAAITRFAQWWVRAVRSGYGLAEGFAMHGRGPARYRRREVLSILFWALLLPVAVAALAWPTNGWAMTGCALYPLQWWRIARTNANRCESRAGAQVYAVFIIVCKWAELWGLFRYTFYHVRRNAACFIAHSVFHRA